MAQITINIDTIPIEYRYSTYPCLCFLLPSISSSRRTPECVRFCQYIVAPWRIIGAHARSLIDSICPKSTLGEVESVVRVCTLTDPILISQVPSLSDSDSNSLSLSHTHTHTLSLYFELLSRSRSRSCCHRILADSVSPLLLAVDYSIRTKITTWLIKRKISDQVLILDTPPSSEKS